MTALLYALGVLLAIAGILLSLGLHELGHLVPAKLFGAKVTEYFFGFGRTLFSFRRGETEYGFKPVPLGAYVKIVGVAPPAPDARGEDGSLTVREGSTGMFSQMMNEARAAEWEQVGPEDLGRLFYKLSWWRKALVYVGGVTMNLVLSAIFFALAYMLIGISVPTTTVATVSKCVTPYNPNQTVASSCTARDRVAPAYAMGIRPGDRVVSFNGHPITQWTQLEQQIRDNRGGAVGLVVERAGHRVTLHGRTIVDARPVDSMGLKTARVGFLGIGPRLDLYVKQGPGYVVRQMGSMTWLSIKAVGQLPVKLYHLTLATLGVEKRSLDSPMGLVGVGRVAGDVTSSSQIDAKDKASALLRVLGGFNLFLAVINLVPLPPFDGGSFFGYLYEGVRRAWDRLRGRPDQERFFDVLRLLPVTYVMVLFVLVTFLITNVADVVVPLKPN